MPTGSGELTAPLVVLGGSYNALSVARGLHPRGVDVRVLADGRSGLAASLARSRAVGRVVVPTGDDLPSGWRRVLERDADGAVVLPGSDEGLEFLVDHDAWLRDRGYRPIEHAGEVNRALLDKEATHQLAGAAGVPAPRVTRVTSATEARARATEVGFPCALKPVHSHRFARAAATSQAGKGAIVRAPDEVGPAYERLARTGQPLLVTELVPGPDADFCSYYSYLDADGRPLLHFTKRKPRQFPVRFGLGSFHRTDWLPDAAELGLRMFQRSGVRGIANVEFKRDARDGQLKLIECNLRLTAADDLVRRAGVDLGWLAYQRALGHTDQSPAGPPTGDGFRAGLVQWLPLRDLRALRRYRAEDELTLEAWARSLLAPISTPVFSLRDPGPSLANAARLLGRLAGRR